MLENIPDTFLSVTNREFRVLLAIENNMKFYEWVPVEELAGFTGFDTKETGFILAGLAGKKLVHRNVGTYEGYRIYFEAYDLLALRAFVARGSVNAIGDRIGAGKESVVYAATGGITGREVVIKFHREGKTSFKKVRIKREHAADKKHLSWLYASRLAAEREYEAMKIIYPRVSVPEPIDHNRHAIVMSALKGQALAHTVVDDPEWFLGDLLDQVKRMAELGFVHSDLSEFNVFVHPEGCELIDLPQYVTLSHPNAKELLHRDVDNIITFFKKKYGIRRDADEEVEKILELCRKK